MWWIRRICADKSKRIRVNPPNPLNPRSIVFAASTLRYLHGIAGCDTFLGVAS